MPPTATVLSVAVIILLAVQAVLLFRQGSQKQVGSDQKRSFFEKHLLVLGTLNFLLAIAAFAAYFLFVSGSLILSPEYRILITQGRTSWFLTVSTIIGCAVGVGMVLHTVRCLRKLPSRLGWLIVGGIIVGVIAAYRNSILNPAESSGMTLDPLESGALRIRCVDLWSYFLLAWLVTLLTEAFLVTIQREDVGVPWRRRLTVIGIALISCALLVSQHTKSGFVHADSLTPVLWRDTLFLVVPGVMGMLTWSALRSNRHPIITRILQIALTIIAVLAGLLTATLWTVYEPFLARRAEGICITLWSTWALAISLVTGSRWYRSRREARSADAASPSRSLIRIAVENSRLRGLNYLRELRRIWRLDCIVALLALLVMLVSLAEIFHYARLNAVWDLIALFASWLMLSEIVGGYPLLLACKKIWTAIARIGTASSASKTDANVSSSKAENNSPKAPLLRSLFGAGAILKVIIVLIALTAAAQIPDAGKTIVEPFTSVEVTPKTKDSPDNKETVKVLGQLVSERVVNTIGLVGEEFRPELLIAGSGGQVQWRSVSGDQESDVQASLGSTSVQIPGTNISVPVGFLLTPIQTPMRWLLRIRTIRGALVKDDNNYVLFASSSSGETWRVGKEGLASNPDEKPSEGHSENQIQETQPATTAAIAELADTLAYKIISSDQSLRVLGITSIASALPDYRDGVAQWSKFQISRDLDVLSTSIQCFHRAVEKDPQFALAHYKLGQAYLQDGQPHAAVNSFRDSVRVNPTFAGGHIALAETLYYLDSSYHYPLPAAVSAAVVPKYRGPDATERDLREARSELHEVVAEPGSKVNVPWRAAAYFGLCRDAYMRGLGIKENASPLTNLRNSYVTFFYCRRAEYLYTQLPSAVRADPEVKDKEIGVLAHLGFILSNSGNQESVPIRHVMERVNAKEEGNEAEVKWLCNPDAMVQPFSSYNHTAERYYRLALERSSGSSSWDDFIRCEYANLRLLEWDPGPMIELNEDDRAHGALAYKLIGRAEDSNKPTNADDLYGEALSEFNSAIKLVPHNASLLNSYAYNVWKWHWARIRHACNRGPDAKTLDTATDYADTAVRLTEKKGLRTDHDIYQSTLGELQLASQKVGLALDTLEKIRGLSQHAMFDEIRWDLAQASVCAGSKKDEQAKEALNTIKENERRREDRRFFGEDSIEQLKQNCQYFGASPSQQVLPKD